MHAEHQSGELKKSLGALNLILLGIGCIIGTGIFVLTGRASAEFAGPGIMISFVLTGVLCALVALCYSELAAAIPVSGSGSSYCAARITPTSITSMTISGSSSTIRRSDTTIAIPMSANVCNLRFPTPTRS